MEHEELAYYLAIHTVTFAGAQKIQHLIKHFGGAGEVWKADPGELRAFGLSSSKIGELLEARRNIDPLREYEALIKKGFRATTVMDEEYPELLKNIQQPPAVLYSLGSIEKLNDHAVAVVGARKATPYGRKVARSLSRDLAEAGYWVVSGMARGIDTESHLGALDSTGRTVAVLGSGLDVIYPRENRGLYNRIAETGVVMSEFPPSTPPEARNFPIRNRIISGLSRGVLVVEAQAKSGALITADFALEQGRDVFAIPGPITSRTSQGSNNLIKQGAKLVSCVEDILEEYQLVLHHQEEGSFVPSVGEEARRVLEAMGPEPVHLDDLAAQTGLSPSKLAGPLLELQISGIIDAVPGNYFIKLRDI